MEILERNGGFKMFEWENMGKQILNGEMSL